MSSSSLPEIVQVDSMLKDLIPLFMQNRRKEIAQMEEMYAKQDFEAFSQYGHQLKGVSYNYGYQKLGDLGLAIETAAKNKNLATLRELMDQIVEHLSRIEVVFKD